MRKKNVAFLFILAVLSFSCQSKKEPIKKIALPRANHIVVVIEENHGFGKIIGSKEAPYINQLAKKSALFTNAHGVTHPSQPNYLALFSGSQQGVHNDHCLKKDSPFHTPNLAADLLKKGLTFKGYAQTMPSVGYRGCNYKRSSLTHGYLYARKHTPWINWIGKGKNNIPDSLSLPMSKFPEDFNDLPTLAFVIPDQDHDMHNMGALSDASAIKRGDEWLKQHLNSYVQWAKTHNSILILTFDEDDFTRDNHIITLFFGSMIRVGKYPERIDHYNVLHTIEDLYNLSFRGTRKGNIIENIWKK